MYISLKMMVIGGTVSVGRAANAFHRSVIRRPDTRWRRKMNRSLMDLPHSQQGQND